MLEILNEYETN